ncbi:cyclin-J18-like isoform X1 [Sorghum bicolor]|uniref:cyclin-J18-like isoform X1 n=1 Tax=Sorghum bicolor TaxID=4558 RepID=UPI000B4266F1|nr:cyclin-J18-like isoform X1 [Sorghum bicolor]|eukprot:XP_021316449.1 cyclin-J18-like isoform X1 [Sorghum bicolor]
MRRRRGGRVHSSAATSSSSFSTPPSGSTSGPSSSTPRLPSSPTASSRRSRGDPSFTPSCLGDDGPQFLIPCPGCCRKMGYCGARSGRVVRSWLLEPLRDSNLELFALVAVWIASKIHDRRPLSVKSLKALGDRIIADQHFMCRDFAAAELVFLEVVDHNIGSSSIAFIYLEDLLIHFREISKLGELLDLEVCMEILDILYETEDTSLLFNSPCSLAASTLVAAYAISVPKQTWEFPILPWVRFVTSYDEEEIIKIVLTILLHVLKPDEIKEKDKGGFNARRCLS